jgi:hypothetical protein
MRRVGHWAHLEELVDVDAARAVEVHQLQHAVHVLQLAVRVQRLVQQLRALAELVHGDDLGLAN